MKTLYDVLGVSSQATPEQIDQAYRFCLDSITSQRNQAPTEENLIRGKAAKEAYEVLSSPERRQLYDVKLNTKAARIVTPVVVEKSEFAWLKYALPVLVLAGIFSVYKIQVHKAEVERVALEVAKAKAEAELAEKTALAEQAKLDQQRLHDQRVAQINQQREIEQARRDGQSVHYQMERMQSQEIRRKEMEERQAKYEQQREEQAAQARSRNEIAAMQRALSIPIGRR